MNDSNITCLAENSARVSPPRYKNYYRAEIDGVYSIMVYVDSRPLDDGPALARIVAGEAMAAMWGLFVDDFLLHRHSRVWAENCQSFQTGALSLP